MTFQILMKANESCIGRVVILYPLYDKTLANLADIGDGRLYGVIESYTSNKTKGQSGTFRGEILNINDEGESDALIFSTPTLLSEKDTEDFRSTFPGWFI